MLYNKGKQSKGAVYLKVINETLQTPITHTCDVLVAGGGIGGIAAALAAAREDKKVLPLERDSVLCGDRPSGRYGCGYD